MHREWPERVLQNRPNCLRRVTLALMGGSEREPELHLTGVGPGAKCDVPYQRVRPGEAHGELKPRAGYPRREVVQARDELPGFADRIGVFPILIASHPGVTPV